MNEIEIEKTTETTEWVDTPERKAARKSARETVLVPFIVVAAIGLIGLGAAAYNNSTPGKIVTEHTAAAPDAGLADPAEECIAVAFAPELDEDTSNQFMQKVWLYPNATFTNNCDQPVKAVEVKFEMVDDFGDRLPKGYTLKEVVNLDPGASYTTPRGYGFETTEFDPNFDALTTIGIDGYKVGVHSIDIVYAAGTGA
jgi:hypothetical protein